MGITYLKLTDGQWVYLASILELTSHKILAHQISATMDTKLVVSIVTKGIIAQLDYLHTDMGSQFTSFCFEQVLKQQAIVHPYDNAKIESRK
ncbi:DDE-type integrase/transposase/recombinase [uncultured Leuconostoc sp.]|uniref:DDE-type integrase/transposase/recombinase n=1 Tax=uncultured Leuconostoc sp. TaxID=173262 RepID=UPI003453AD77